MSAIEKIIKYHDANCAKKELCHYGDEARTELSALRSASSERDKWRAWCPDDEDLADMKQQAQARDGSYTECLAASAIYIGALEARLRERDAAIERAVKAERQLSDAREVVNGLIAAIVMDSKDNNSISGYTGARLSDARAWEKHELERTAAIRARGEKEM